jgi:hypothetical protein
MASNTFTLISSVTVGAGGAASIDFTSIPATYTDLVVDLSGRSTRSNTTDTVFLKFNNTNTTYTNRRLSGYGSTTGSDTGSTGNGIDVATINGATSTASTFSNQQIYIPNYAGSNQKSISYDGVSENNSATGNFLVFNAGLWNGTAAVNQITLTPDVGTFVQYSTAYLYGVKNA